MKVKDNKPGEKKIIFRRIPALNFINKNNKAIAITNAITTAIIIWLNSPASFGAGVSNPKGNSGALTFVETPSIVLTEE